jgi:hypothetical protein
VVGKFAPLHRGHALVIDEARRQCEKVVLLSYSRPEIRGSEPERRARWLRDLYPDCERWVLTDEMLRERLGSDARPLPPNVAPDDEQRDFVAWFCLHVRGAPVDAVFTSESYGDGFAARLTRRFRETGALTATSRT